MIDINKIKLNDNEDIDELAEISNELSDTVNDYYNGELTYKDCMKIKEELSDRLETIGL